jgi:hypothetical protein
MLSCLFKNNFLCVITISCKKIYLKTKTNFLFKLKEKKKNNKKLLKTN